MADVERCSKTLILCSGRFVSFQSDDEIFQVGAAPCISVSTADFTYGTKGDGKRRKWMRGKDNENITVREEITI